MVAFPSASWNALKAGSQQEVERRRKVSDTRSMLVGSEFRQELGIRIRQYKLTRILEIHEGVFVPSAERHISRGSISAGGPCWSRPYQKNCRLLQIIFLVLGSEYRVPLLRRLATRESSGMQRGSPSVGVKRCLAIMHQEGGSEVDSDKSKYRGDFRVESDEQYGMEENATGAIGWRWTTARAGRLVTSHKP
jgi:hypothetical protein